MASVEERSEAAAPGALEVMRRQATLVAQCAGTYFGAGNTYSRGNAGPSFAALATRLLSEINLEVMNEQLVTHYMRPPISSFEGFFDSEENPFLIQLVNSTFKQLSKEPLAAGDFPKSCRDAVRKMERAESTELDLSGMRLTRIPWASASVLIYGGILLTNLTVLRLHGNQIVDIPAGCFASLTKLTKLGLHNNKISDIPEGCFATLTNLEKLYLDGNQISDIPAGCFASLTKLKVLWLNGNDALLASDQGQACCLTSGNAFEQIAKLKEWSESHQQQQASDRRTHARTNCVICRRCAHAPLLETQHRTDRLTRTDGTQHRTDQLTRPGGPRRHCCYYRCCHSRFRRSG